MIPFMSRAAVAATSRPVETWPVKETFAIEGWATKVRPTVGPSPWSTLKTPAGRPAVL